MDGDCAQFFTCACLARDQYRGIRTRNPADRIEQLQHRIACADHAALGNGNFRRELPCQSGHTVGMAYRVGDPLLACRHSDVIEAEVS